MYIDLFVNKENTSYLTTACIFYAMLLYDHEKIIKTTKNKTQRNVSKCTAVAYIVILLVHIVLLLGMYNKAVVLKQSTQGLLGLKIEFLDKMDLHVDWPFGVIGFIVMILTFVEIFSESEDNTIGGNVTTDENLTPAKGESITEQGNLTEKTVSVVHSK